jgi:hypothetical protein
MLLFSKAPGIEQLSLLQQVRLIKNNFHIRLHIKIVVDPGSPTIDQQVSAMRQLYASIGIAVVIRSVETLNLSSSFQDIWVGSCTKASGKISGEMLVLFKNLNNVPINTLKFEVGGSPPSHILRKVTHRLTNELLIYYASTVPGVDANGNNIQNNGCSSYPKAAVISQTHATPTGGTAELPVVLEEWLTVPGTVLASNPTVWTLAHEVGHIFGLDHIDTPSSCQSNSLMTSCSTNTITSPPPDLSSSEIATIVTTGLNFFKKCGDL